MRSIPLTFTFPLPNVSPPRSISSSRLTLPSLSLSSAAVLLRGIHRVWLLQRHRVPDGLWRPLFEVDRVPGLRGAVPGPGAGRPQLLQEPRPGVQPLVLLQTELWGHRLGLLRLPPGYDRRDAPPPYQGRLCFYSTPLKSVYQAIYDYHRAFL